MNSNSPDQMRKLANLLNENIQPMVESADAAEEFEYIQAESA